MNSADQSYDKFLTGEISDNQKRLKTPGLTKQQVDKLTQFLKEKERLRELLRSPTGFGESITSSLQRLRDDVVALEMFDHYSKVSMAVVPKAFIKWGKIWKRENPTAGNPTRNQILELAKRKLELAEKKSERQA